MDDLQFIPPFVYRQWANDRSFGKKAPTFPSDINDSIMFFSGEHCTAKQLLNFLLINGTQDPSVGFDK